ncbi:hypothetical protein [Cupriavidus pauculus]|uniref:hypothetical protein n=1 Tax=Cupriavidus pauculus TaxID=82633 RepID=UPI001EE185CC|nr:hypothetical protein [Cupriavidus pauculus]GJG92876.1 hypothetical protein CBA19C6_00325 [Cupriavidus pauculus]
MAKTKTKATNTESLMLTITRKHLSDAFKAASQAAPSKSPLHILTHIRLQATEDVQAVTLTGSNTHMTVQATVPAEIFGDCIDICLPADKLSALVGMTAEDVSFTAKDAKVIARAGSCRLTIPSLPGRDFPEARIEGEPIAVLDAPGLTEMIPTVSFAVAGMFRHDKPILRNLWIECDGEAVHMVGCDSFMLAANSLLVAPAEFGETIAPFGVCLAADGADLLSKVGATRFEIYEKHIVGSRDGIRIECGHQGAKYFDWRRMIPKADQFVTFSRDELLQICPLHRVFDQKGVIRFEQDGADCAITITDGMQAVDAEIPVKARSEEAHLDNSFDGPNLLRLLGQVKTDDVALSWASQGKQDFSVYLLQDGSWRGILTSLRV